MSNEFVDFIIVVSEYHLSTLKRLEICVISETFKTTKKTEAAF